MFKNINFNQTIFFPRGACPHIPLKASIHLVHLLVGLHPPAKRPAYRSDHDCEDGTTYLERKEGLVIFQNAGCLNAIFLKLLRNMSS